MKYARFTQFYHEYPLCVYVAVETIRQLCFFVENGPHGLFGCLIFIDGTDTPFIVRGNEATVREAIRGACPL